jgi:N-methylhydantoinase B
VPAPGADGGRPGALGRAIHRRGDAERAMPSRFSGLALERGDACILEKAGGGGLGDPRKRPFDAIVDDVLDGFVSRQAAIDEYGADAARLDAALAAWYDVELASPRA